MRMNFLQANTLYISGISSTAAIESRRFRIDFLGEVTDEPSEKCKLAKLSLKHISITNGSKMHPHPWLCSQFPVFDTAVGTRILILTLIGSIIRCTKHRREDISISPHFLNRLPKKCYCSIYVLLKLTDEIDMPCVAHIPKIGIVDPWMWGPKTCTRRTY